MRLEDSGMGERLQHLADARPADAERRGQRLFSGSLPPGAQWFSFMALIIWAITSS
jgi:hypothetical protein